jgi:hypothetical protein
MTENKPPHAQSAHGSHATVSKMGATVTFPCPVGLLRSIFREHRDRKQDAGEWTAEDETDFVIWKNMTWGKPEYWSDEKERAFLLKRLLPPTQQVGQSSASTEPCFRVATIIFTMGSP